MSSVVQRWLRRPIALVLVLACRPGEGDNCVCEGECRAGLVCAQGGQVLTAGECVSANANSEPGRSTAMSYGRGRITTASN